MKRLTNVLCLVLALTMVLAIPVGAQEISPYSSSYFGSYNSYLWESSGTSFQVWFSVTAVNTMTELGVNYIDIEKSSDGSDWDVVKTYTKEDYSNMVASNTVSHASYVTYSNRQSGYQYRAYVELYAKNSSGGRAYYGVYAYF